MGLVIIRHVQPLIHCVHMKRLLLLVLLSIIIFPVTAFAQEVKTVPVEALPPGQVAPAEIETIEIKAKITEIIEKYDIDGDFQAKFLAEADGKVYTVDTGEGYTKGLRYDLHEGQKVFLQVILSDGEISQVFLVDVWRIPALVLMFALFSVVILIVGRLRGLFALIGLLVTVGILFLFIFPSILAGHDAVLITVIGGIVILGVNMAFSHGLNRRTLAAYASTVIGLFLAWLFGSVFVDYSSLSGLASEEVIFLSFEMGDLILPQGLLLAGVILGAIGVLDDIAITQTEAVQEIRAADAKLSSKELYHRAMRIGRHHIASTVNTLVLAYVAVAMPLFLLFLIAPEIDFIRFINEELVAEEIVRTLAGTMALVLTVPISTFMAVRFGGSKECEHK
jgi:uncharacterized membrane protein